MGRVQSGSKVADKSCHSRHETSVALRDPILPQSPGDPVVRLPGCSSSARASTSSAATRSGFEEVQRTHQVSRGRGPRCLAQKACILQHRFETMSPAFVFGADGEGRGVGVADLDGVSYRVVSCRVVGRQDVFDRPMGDDQMLPDQDLCTGRPPGVVGT